MPRVGFSFIFLQLNLISISSSLYARRAYTESQSIGILLPFLGVHKSEEDSNRIIVSREDIISSGWPLLRPFSSIRTHSTHQSYSWVVLISTESLGTASSICSQAPLGAILRLQPCSNAGGAGSIPPGGEDP